MAKTTVDQQTFDGMLAKGQKSFANMHFSQLSLYLFGHLGLSFEDCEFFGCQLGSGSFSQYTLKDCWFSSCDFTSMPIRDSEFHSCRFELGTLSDTDVKDTKFFECRLDRVLLARTIFLNCELNKVQWEFGSAEAFRFAEGEIKDSRFFAVEMKRCGFSGSDLKGVMFRGCTMNDGYFDGCEIEGEGFLDSTRFRRGKFKNSYLKDVRFIWFDGYKTSWTDSTMEDCSFYAGSLRQATDLSTVFVKGTFELEKTSLTGSDWENNPPGGIKYTVAYGVGEVIVGADSGMTWDWKVSSVDRKTPHIYLEQDKYRAAIYFDEPSSTMTFYVAETTPKFKLFATKDKKERPRDITVDDVDELLAWAEDEIDYLTGRATRPKSAGIQESVAEDVGLEAGDVIETSEGVSREWRVTSTMLDDPPYVVHLESGPNALQVMATDTEVNYVLEGPPFPKNYLEGGGFPHSGDVQFRFGDIQNALIWAEEKLGEAAWVWVDEDTPRGERSDFPAKTMWEHGPEYEEADDPYEHLKPKELREGPIPEVRIPEPTEEEKRAFAEAVAEYSKLGGSQASFTEEQMERWRRLSPEIYENPRSAKALMGHCQLRWEIYDAKPTKKNLMAFGKCIGRMKATKSARVKQERRRALRAFRKEMRDTGWKMPKKDPTRG
jgi:fluoroquinolone resistance protein